jgi:uncharacterized protein (TIGR02271 family)
MPENSSRVVISKEGRLGRTVPSHRQDQSEQNHILVSFDTGEDAWIPFDHLKLLPDGSYFLSAEADSTQWKPGRREDRSDQTEKDLVVPVIEEEIEIGKRVSHEKVQISKQVHEEEVEINEPSFREEIEIERIPKNEMLDAPVEPYTEGEIMVIPVVEERVVVTKHLVLVEEIRVKKIRIEVREPQRVMLRREEVKVDRDNP